MFETLNRLHNIAFITESTGSSEFEGTNAKGEKEKFTISFTKRAKKEGGGVVEQYVVDKITPASVTIDGIDAQEWAKSKLSPKKEIKESFAARQGESTFEYTDGKNAKHSISCTWEYEGGSYVILSIAVNGKPSTNPKVEKWCERKCLEQNVAANAKASRAHRFAARQDDYRADDDYADTDNDYTGQSMGGGQDDYWRR